MHEAALARAARQAPAVVLGLPLRPYSLGHELCLIRENNPLAEIDTASAGQLAEAVWICSCGWEELGVSMWAILKVNLWQLRLRWLKWRGRGFDVAGEIARFADYRKEGMLDFPIVDTIDPGRTQSRTPGAPYVLRLQQFLMLHFGKSEIEAWNYPYGFAQQRFEAFWEQNGGVKITNSLEQEEEAWHKQEANGEAVLHG